MISCVAIINDNTPLTIQHPDLNLNFQNEDGDTLFHSLVSNTRFFKITCLLMISSRFDLNIVNNKQQIPLDIAFSKQSMDIIALLLGCKVVYVCSYWWSNNFSRSPNTRNQAQNLILKINEKLIHRV